MVKSSAQDPEQLPKVHIIRSLLESQSSAIVQIHGKLSGKVLAEGLDRCRHFLFTDLVVLLFLVASLESLPGKGATQEVHEDIAEGLHVITTTLFYSQVGIYTGIAGSAWMKKVMFSNISYQQIV